MLVIVHRDARQPYLDVWKPGPGAARAERVRRCPCAVGMEGFSTPKGVYETGGRTLRPDWKAPNWVDPPLVPGTIYRFGSPFNPYQHGLISLHGESVRGHERTGYALHGTTNEQSIPGHASHGCIRLREEDILWLYERLDDNTMVVVC